MKLDSKEQLSEGAIAWIKENGTGRYAVKLPMALY